jgi:hypothetical protein
LVVIAVYIALIACIHVVEAVAVIIIQSADLVEALTSGLFAIVFEAYEILGWWELVASFCFGTAISFDAHGRASTSRGVDRRIHSLNSTILEPLPCRIDTFSVVSSRVRIK